jgi:hypothetical protein
VASKLPFIRVKSDHFDDEATRIMGEAFDMACAELRDGNLSDLNRKAIAERIIEAAKKGERHPQRLCSVGIAGIGSDRRTG